MSTSLQECRFVGQAEDPAWAKPAVTRWLADRNVRPCCASSVPVGDALLTGEYAIVEVTISPSWPGPAWVSPTIQAIERLTQLPPGWDSYGARRIEARAVEAIVQMLGRTMQCDSPAPTVVPTANGGLQAEWHTGGIDLEVEATPDGRVFMSCEGIAHTALQESEITQDSAPLAEVIAAL